MAYDKVVDSAQLDSIFTDIADAVRERGGTSDEINHTSIADAVLTIPVTVENAWEKYSYGLTYSKGFTVVVARVSNDSVLPAGSVGITLYKEIVYDESTNTFSGGEKVLSYTQNEDKYNGDILLAEEQIPDKAYIYNGLWYETRPDTRLYVEKRENYVDGGYTMTARLTPLDQVTGYGKGEFVGNVVSDIANAYPDSGVQDGFYYEKIKLASDSHDYVWEKYEANITEAYDTTNIYHSTYHSSSYIYYSSVGNLYFYPSLKFDSLGKLTTTGTATYLGYSSLTTTYFYDGDVIYDASRIPDDRYFISNGKVYKTTPTTRLVAKLSGSYVYARFENVFKVDGSLTLLTHVASDNSDEYPAAGSADDGFYYKKVLPLSLETDLVAGNIRNGVNILGVTGTYLRDTDSDLIASNIKKGVNIYGVTGTYEGESSAGTVTITVSAADYMYALFYQNGNSVLKATTAGSYTVNKNSIYVIVLRRNTTAPTVSGASYKQYYSGSVTSKSNTVNYFRVYAFLADSNVTLSC